MYYYIGHFSKFIRPNAKRVLETVNDKSLLSTSFKNSDGKLITIVMNQSEKEIIYSLENQKEKTIITIPAHAIQTIVN
ncbi:glycoside hydrolase family 30 beta sandwich domain-containing protein [Flavobacterium sp. MMS24-S5]|uniref:glycoside hydrolase family 30 beta sandwich domain-containing protein n=1 Tax=Flavobacterium sp. MMS24-S5 TaxID=3416605 RepID=UPI003D08F8A8